MGSLVFFEKFLYYDFNSSKSWGVVTRSKFSYLQVTGVLICGLVLTHGFKAFSADKNRSIFTFFQNNRRSTSPPKKIGHRIVRFIPNSLGPSWEQFFPHNTGAKRRSEEGGTRHKKQALRGEAIALLALVGDTIPGQLLIQFSEEIQAVLDYVHQTASQSTDSLANAEKNLNSKGLLVKRNTKNQTLIFFPARERNSREDLHDHLSIEVRGDQVILNPKRFKSVGYTVDAKLVIGLKTKNLVDSETQLYRLEDSGNHVLIRFKKGNWIDTRIAAEGLIVSASNHSTSTHSADSW